MDLGAVGPLDGNRLLSLNKPVCDVGPRSRIRRSSVTHLCKQKAGLLAASSDSFVHFRARTRSDVRLFTKYPFFLDVVHYAVRRGLAWKPQWAVFVTKTRANSLPTFGFCQFFPCSKAIFFVRFKQ